MSLVLCVNLYQSGKTLVMSDPKNFYDLFLNSSVDFEEHRKVHVFGIILRVFWT